MEGVTTTTGDTSGIGAESIPSSSSQLPISMTERQAGVTEYLDQAEAELNGVRDELLAGARGALMSADADLAGVQLELIGRVNAALDKVESELSKPLAKIQNGIVDQVSDAYKQLAAAGIQPPVMLSDVEAELARPDPTEWVLARLGMGQCLFTNGEGTTRVDACPSPDQSAPPLKTELDKGPVDSGTVWSPPIVLEPVGLPWPPKSIFDAPTCIVNMDPNEPSNAVLVDGVWYSPNGDFIRRRDGCEIITGALYGDYVTGRVPIPAGATGVDLYMDSCGWREYYLCWPVGKTPSPPTTPPKTPPTVPTDPSCVPVCVGQSFAATITIGASCGPGTGTSPPTTPPTTPKTPPPPGTPPTAPGPEKGAEITGLPRSEWDTPKACEVATNAMIGTDKAPITTIGGGLEWLMPVVAGGIASLLPSWAQIDPIGDTGKKFQEALQTAIKTGTNGVDTILNKMEGDGWPINHLTWSTMGILTLAGFTERWLGAPMNYIVTPIAQYMRYSFPVEIPTQAEVDALYLTNRIDHAWWTCLTRANGNLPGLHEKARDAKATRTNLGEVIQLYYRGAISKEEMIVEGRKLGVLDERELYWMTILFQQIPSMSDLIDMMRKEADVDESVLEDGLDLGFDKSFGPQLQLWAKQAGVPLEVMKYNWRSHWREVSPSQSYEMFQRLRPGRNPNGIVFTRERLERYIREDDYPPNIVPQLVEISYKPITRTDAIKGYYAGTIDVKELGERFQDVGYSPQDATVLMHILEDDRKRRTITQSGQWTPRKVAKEYRAGSIDRTRADQLLTPYYADEGTRADVLDNAETIRDAETRATCIKGTRRRYLLGEIDDQGASDDLQKLEVGFTQINKLIDRWRCEKLTRRKEPRVAYLQDWFIKGLITGTQFYQRLINLGYSEGDATRIYQLTLIKETERIAKQAAAAAKEAAAEARRQRAEQRQAKKDAASKNGSAKAGA